LGRFVRIGGDLHNLQNLPNLQNLL